MSSTTTLIEKIVPSSDSPNWPLFVLLIVVTIALGPKALDSWRRYKYSLKPNMERRQSHTCEAHSQRIKDLEDELTDLRLLVSKQISDLRDFIEDKFQQDRESYQRERLAFEANISVQLSNLVRALTK